MKLSTFCDLAIKKGLKDDQRSDKLVDEELKKVKKEYSKKKGVEKETFDKERFKHPYDDTRLLNGKGDENIKNILVGIDIGVGEIILADYLREKGMDIDLVVSHHPSGKGLAQLDKVMKIQPGIWEKYGLSRDVAFGMMDERAQQVERGVSASNHTRVTDAARLLGIPFMCIHTAADNCVANFLQKKLNAKKPKKLKGILSFLRSMPEYRDAMRNGAGPHLLIGKEDDAAGKIFVDMTGGTSGPDSIFGRLSQAGVKTVIGMHCRESGYKAAKSEFINIVIAGHISSDNLGLNLLFDSVEKKEKLNFIECSGFRRYRRT